MADRCFQTHSGFGGATSRQLVVTAALCRGTNTGFHYQPAVLTAATREPDSQGLQPPH